MEHLLPYVSNHPWLVTATVLVAALVLIYEMRTAAETKTTVSPQELIRLMNQGALVLDLRPAEQYQSGHLNGARQLDSHQILNAGEQLKKHKEKPVVVYDESGSLGGPAVRQLVAQGFTQAFALRGGLAAWRADNLPLSRA